MHLRFAKILPVAIGLVGLLGLYLIHRPAFFRPLMSDDFNFFLNNEVVQTRGNSLLFWLRGQPQTKAWPLGYTIFWALYPIFALDLWKYRALNLFVHWSNGALVGWQAAKANRWAGLLAAALVWFHPLTAEPVEWVSQLPTLIAGHLFLWWYYRFVRDGAGFSFARLMLFLGALSAKGYFYFLPVLELRARGPRSGLARALPALPYLALAAYFGFLAAVGVYQTPANALNSRVLLHEIAPPRSEPSGEVRLWIPHVSADESVNLAAGYLHDTLVRNDASRLSLFGFWGKKLSLVGVLFLFYLRQLVFPFTLRATYEIPAAATMGGCLAGLAAFLLLVGFLKKRQWPWAAAILTFLPSSGLFYFPFMNKSLAADRYVYVPLLAIGLGLPALLELGRRRLTGYGASAGK